MLGNVKSDRLHRDDVPLLVDERLAVLEQRIDADLGRGRAAELVAELRSLVAAHPLRETFWRQLMLALYRSGRQAEALAAYRDVRERLADELGVDPGPPLRDLHERILRAEVGQVAGRVVPRQLPAGVRNFVGRTAELAVLGRSDGITLLHGTGGVGKTALALRWAHEVRSEFPDGDLYLNLRGFEQETEPVDPAQAAETLLLGLGASTVPADADARFALLRSEVAGRRLLLVLDNAASSDQVLPLLPGSPGVRVVITSRNQLRPLVSRHSVTTTALRQLDGEESRALLTAVLGAERLAAEPEAAGEIAERCTGLPLALRVFAERVARFPDVSLREFVRELRDERLDALSDFEDVDVRAVFSWSYRALGEDEARMFRLLSVHPGPDFDVSAAAALAGVTVAQARRLLERLVADHLVQSRSPGRYDLHDLLRAYSAELCGDDEAAALRLTEWYAHTAQNAGELHGVVQSLRLDEVTTGVEPQGFTSRFDALTWCRNEWDNLVAVMHAAISRGWDLLAHAIPSQLRTHALIERVRHPELVPLFEAVHEIGPPRAQGLARLKLAGSLADARRFEDAVRGFETALPLVRDPRDQVAVASALNNMALTCRNLGRNEEALGHSRRAIALAVEIGHLPVECVCRTSVLGPLTDLRRYDEVLEEGELARAAVRRLGDEYLEARLDALVAVAVAGLGRLDEAIGMLQRCLEQLHRFSDVRGQIVTLNEDLAPLLFRTGRHDDAVRAWERAYDLARDAGDDRAEGIAVKLALVRGPGPA